MKALPWDLCLEHIYDLIAKREEWNKYIKKGIFTNFTAKQDGTQVFVKYMQGNSSS